MNAGALFAATFLACLVEAVEATTIVLAAGTARDWRSTVKGLLLALLTLAVVIAIVGPAITVLPLGILRVVVGGLLLVFGLQWMRKAILRASGRKALHDETAIFEREAAAARREQRQSGPLGVTDWYAFTLSYKGVFLEGLEVVFIVVTFGANQHSVGLASIAAIAAVLLVTALGFAVRGPLSRVPENTLKYIVGVMLTAFGAFWAGEGAGAHWPGSDAALLVIAPAIAVYSLLLVLVYRRPRPVAGAPAESVGTSGAPSTAPEAGVPMADGADGSAPADSAATSGARTATIAEERPAPVSPAQRRLRAFGMFWYDFLIGDDWTAAATIAAALIVTAAVASFSAGAAWVVPAAAVLFLLPFGVRRAAR
ncbi:COG4280 domain-containing protein [Curtobacterium ammoniigenes]|uniref:COG4280 domain-containing protein n=1 Tax=Curtobacterium ammoniigenes TaxID=395387 RepID=UPI000B31D69E|nr:hypothetical protein [Curtobacterium ammoniigenes]